MISSNNSALLRLYNLYISPYLSKRNKIIGISTAITMSLCYIIRDRVLKPPRQLRHIPYHSHFQVLRAILTGESYWDRSYRLTIPEIDSKESNGIYVVIYKNPMMFIYVNINKMNDLIETGACWMGSSCGQRTRCKADFNKNRFIPKSKCSIQD